MKIQGEVVSYAVMTTTESCQNTGQPHNHAFDGWQAMFRYHCPCGVVHDSQPRLSDNKRAQRSRDSETVIVQG